MAGRLPVTEGMFAIVVRASTAYGGVRRYHPIGEGGQRGDDFEHGARRILPLRGTVMQRKMRVGAQRPPRGQGRPGDKGIWIKGRLACQCENLAITWVESDNR